MSLDTTAAAAFLLLASTCFFAPHTSAQEPSGAGAVISAEASAKDVGLPLYPGSVRHKDKNDDMDGANFGLWGGGSGFKLVVLKMESGDSAEKVANFYKKALAKYGKVLDCSNPVAASQDTKKPATEEEGKSSKVLTCGDDKPEKGGTLYKAGTSDKHHLAAIQPNGKGSLYQLVFVDAWSDQSKK